MSSVTKGWFDIPGVQQGERTLAEQMKGLEFALAECRGKTILDLGCAEGLIAREFCKAGAASVHCIDSVQRHIDMARDVCRGLPCKFVVGHLGHDSETMEPSTVPLPRSDIVLLLAVVHKMLLPAKALATFAAAAKSLVVIRLPVNSMGVVYGKFSRARCDTHAVMHKAGFALERSVEGPRKELVHYWRRGT